MKTDVGERGFQEMLGGYGYLISELNWLLDPRGINTGFPNFPGMLVFCQQCSVQAQAMGKGSLAGIKSTDRRQ